MEMGEGGRDLSALAVEITIEPPIYRHGDTLVHMYTPTPRIPVVHIFGWDWSYITKIRGSINLQYCEYIFPYKILVI